MVPYEAWSRMLLPREKNLVAFYHDKSCMMCAIYFFAFIFDCRQYIDLIGLIHMPSVGSHCVLVCLLFQCARNWHCTREGDHWARMANTQTQPLHVNVENLTFFVMQSWNGLLEGAYRQINVTAMFVKGHLQTDIANLNLSRNTLPLKFHFLMGLKAQNR